MAIYPEFRLISVTQYATPALTFTITDSGGNPVSLLGKGIQFSAWSTEDGGEIKSILFVLDNTGIGGVAIGPLPYNVVTVTIPQADTSVLLTGNGSYNLWNVTDGIALAQGPFTIVPGLLVEDIS